MASFQYHVSASFAMGTCDDEDWMVAPASSRVDQKQAEMAIYKPVVKPIATPARAEKPEAPSWACPQAPAARKVRGGRLSNAQKAEYDRNTAKALAAAQAASRAAEQSVKLAAMAQKQAAQTAAKMAIQGNTKGNGKGKKRSPPVADQPAIENGQVASPPVADQPAAEKGQVASAAAADQPAAAKGDLACLVDEEPGAAEAAGSEGNVPAAETAEPLLKRRKRGECNTFAGYRPPADETLLKEFEYKKEMYSQTRAYLCKKFPGKEVLIGKTAKQTEYWTYIKDALNKEFKNLRKKDTSQRPTQEAIKKAIKKAAEAWQNRLEKSLSSQKK